MIRRFLFEPLVHFLVAGGALLVLSALFGRLPASPSEQSRIQVTEATIRQLRETWSAQWGAQPSATQLQSLVDDLVREEILYREAVASGLDQGDTIIRRHLAQKIEFLAQGVAIGTEPSDTELRQFFDRFKAKYVVPSKVAFTHVYFSVSKRGPAASLVATDALVALREHRMAAVTAADLGDSFMLQHEYPLRSQAEIRELFGGEFAAALFTLPVGQWQGPVVSSYGVHDVRIDQRVAARLPDREEVRSQVTLDFNDTRIALTTDAYYQKVRQRYRVDIARDAVSGE